MGLHKRLMEAYRERGYGPSDAKVCQECFGDMYLKRYILKNGEKGTCSFCKSSTGQPARRKVLPLEELMHPIMDAVRTYYFPADENAIWDSEEHSYVDPVVDVEDVIEELENYMLSAGEGQKEAILDILDPDLFVESRRIEQSPEEKDLELWVQYSKLVKARDDLSAEQIVSLCTREEAPQDLQEMWKCLDMVYHHCKQMKMFRTIHTSETVFRCVRRNAPPAGFAYIPATLVGTAPARFVADNRMSEEGDMMFYGASNLEASLREVFDESKSELYTIGRFYGNKRVKVLDLSGIAKWRCPSIFDVANRQARSVWLFLKEFIKEISLPVQSGKEEYKPTQVLTKYIQRKTQLKGIAYRSSKSPHNSENTGYCCDRCFVLFVTNRDCIDQCETPDKSRYQLVMEPGPIQLDPSEVKQRI